MWITCNSSIIVVIYILRICLPSASSYESIRRNYSRTAYKPRQADRKAALCLFSLLANVLHLIHGGVYVMMCSK